MLVFVILPLLALLPSNFGTLSQPIHISPTQLPALPAFARMAFLEHASVTSASASFNPLHAVRRRNFKYLSAAPAPSPASQDALSTPTRRNFRRHHRHGHRARSPEVSPSPSATLGNVLTNDVFRP
ncbi:hypothetical protein CDL12_30453 [Handroanthus impetiginosus]|uniref:Secreted protein n=1 Tax=Handroanthus impetiginosus TaxID=429701 RepID=A0A2G9FW09_9LAMI|nr:hypothetical protein CDL12_30453 [Handroanthus impetiginosus]